MKQIFKNLIIFSLAIGGYWLYENSSEEVSPATNINNDTTQKPSYSSEELLELSLGNELLEDDSLVNPLNKIDAKKLLTKKNNENHRTPSAGHSQNKNLPASSHKPLSQFLEKLFVAVKKIFAGNAVEKQEIENTSVKSNDSPPIREVVKTPVQPVLEKSKIEPATAVEIKQPDSTVRSPAKFNETPSYSEPSNYDPGNEQSPENGVINSGLPDGTYAPTITNPDYYNENRD